MSQIWKFTGTPENWLTAIRLNKWAFNEGGKTRWPKVKTGDTILFHSTRRSDYTNDAVSAIIGFAYVGDGKYKKNELWWPDEIRDNVNRWPYVIPLKEIYLFSDIDQINIDTPVTEKKEEEIRKDIKILLSEAISIASLNKKAKNINKDYPEFPVNGPASGVNEIYEKLILEEEKDLSIVSKNQDTELLEKRLGESLDEKLSTQSTKEVLEQAKSYFDDKPSHIESNKPHRIRRENQLQKRRVARLEDYTCQVCSFKSPYIKKNGSTGWIIHIDHIIEKSEGGGEDLNNLWALCPNCHAKKTYGTIEINPETKEVKENGIKIDIKDNHWQS